MVVFEVSSAESLRDLRMRWVRILGVCVVLFVASGLIQGLAPKGPLISGAEKMEFSIDEAVLDTRAGSGLIFGILGGFRTLVADVMWLRMHEAWMDKDLAETEALINLTVLIDPRPFTFWQAGSHTIAFDMPVWRIRQGGGESIMPESLQSTIREEQGLRSVRFLEQGAAIHPDDPRFPIEIGKIYLNAVKDEAKTIEYFRKAWEMPNRPYYIGRLLARVLENAGQPREALEVLYQDYERLPKDDPEAFIPLVLERIAELERALGVAKG